MGLVQGLEPITYQGIFAHFLVPIKVHCIAVSVCLTPGPGPTPIVRVKTLALSE